MFAHNDWLMIPCQTRDVFISCSQEETQDMLEAAKKVCEKKWMPLKPGWHPFKSTSNGIKRKLIWGWLSGLRVNALLMNLGLVPSAHRHLSLQLRRIWRPLLASSAPAPTYIYNAYFKNESLKSFIYLMETCLFSHLDYLFLYFWRRQHSYMDFAWWLSQV